jgi:hypothetical protein
VVLSGLRVTVCKNCNCILTKQTYDYFKIMEKPFMNMKRFVSLLTVVFLAVAPLVAEEEEGVNPAIACDEKYDVCMDKCPEAPEGADKCYQTCDTAYEACLSQAENTPQASE